MGSLVLLFLITLSVILFASYREVRRNNSEKLNRYVDLFILEQDRDIDSESPESRPAPDSLSDLPPWSKDGSPPTEEGSDYRLSTFYAVVLSKEGGILRIENDEKSIYSDEDLAEIAASVLESGRSSGKTGSLLYCMDERPGYTLAAFLDITVTESNLSILLHNVLIAGGLAMVLLFFIALFLARKIVRPLEENDRRQKQFISDASHELKTPISVIGANAEILSREIGRSEWLDNIFYESGRMGSLVKQLLDLSRAENADVPKEHLDLSRLVAGEVLVFESLAFDRDKNISSSIEDDIYVTGNCSQIQQLVSILLDNAIRHSEGPAIDLSLKRQSHSAVLSVENSGRAIPAEKMKHLFDRFYRVDEARSSEDSHYGLGLSIAKAVAERHRGTIGVSCRDNKVRFTVSLPL